MEEKKKPDADVSESVKARRQREEDREWECYKAAFKDGGLRLHEEHVEAIGREESEVEWEDVPGGEQAPLTPRMSPRGEEAGGNKGLSQATDDDPRWRCGVCGEDEGVEEGRRPVVIKVPHRVSKEERPIMRRRTHRSGHGADTVSKAGHTRWAT